MPPAPQRFSLIFPTSESTGEPRSGRDFADRCVTTPPHGHADAPLSVRSCLARRTAKPPPFALFIRHGPDRRANRIDQRPWQLGRDPFSALRRLTIQWLAHRSLELD
jgi:hypothetical protein